MTPAHCHGVSALAYNAERHTVEYYVTAGTHTLSGYAWGRREADGRWTYGGVSPGSLARINNCELDNPTRTAALTAIAIAAEKEANR